MKNILSKLKFWHYGVALFLVVFLLDQLTKYWIVAEYALYESRQQLPFLAFTYIQNTGMTWGLFQGANMFLIWFSIFAFGLLVFFYDEFKTPLEKVGYVLLLAGLWGNLIDRVSRGFVVDFIDLGWWPIFNIADSAINVGIGLYILAQIYSSLKGRKSPVRTE